MFPEETEMDASKPYWSSNWISGALFGWDGEPRIHRRSHEVIGCSAYYELSGVVIWRFELLTIKRDAS